MILGIGADCVEVEQMRLALERGGKRLRQRVFTASELRYCTGRRREAEHLAARFAAKEACFKALGTGWGRQAGWKDVEVVRGGKGPPTLRLTGRAASTARRLGVHSSHLSLSHTSRAAMAVVILER
ncbi:MAG: holo-ACP synthase [Acidobacteriota bacterium]